MSNVAVSLSEWETARPDSGSPLAGLSLAGSPVGRRIAEELTSSGKLEVLELASGLELRASSYVGSLVLGEVKVTIQPKLPGVPLLHLLRYAYGLRHLSLFREVNFATSKWTFQDLLVLQLATEEAELLSRGLHRDYKSKTAKLADLRGRIDFQKYVKFAGGAEAVLPCVFYPRLEDTLLNQVLLSGLLLASRLTTDIDLRVHLRRMAQGFDPNVSSLKLDTSTLQKAWRVIDRRTSIYKPALTLIELLVQSEGIALENQPVGLNLPGFLFDMNRFFQALMSRFLREHLGDYVVQDEYRMKELFFYDPAHNPRRRRAPTPRPDFAVRRDNQIVAILDAKYRDLWEHALPREMLYQLALYALGQAGPTSRQATILYPTLDSKAIEQVIVVQEPVHGTASARVVLRPVKLHEMVDLLRANFDQQVWRKRVELAHRLAFGVAPEFDH